MQCANIIWWHCNMSYAYNGIITISTFQHKTHTMRHTSLYQILNGIGMCWLLDEWIFNISFHLYVFLCLCIVPSVFVLIPVRMDLVTCSFLPVSPRSLQLFAQFTHLSLIYFVRRVPCTMCVQETRIELKLNTLWILCGRREATKIAL